MEGLPHKVADLAVPARLLNHTLTNTQQKSADPGIEP